MGEDLRNRIAGSFYGLLVGDALGWPVEGFSAAEIRQQFGEIHMMVESPQRLRPRGFHSDDGQQAIAVCDAVLESPTRPGPVFARLITEMLSRKPVSPSAFGVHRGIGPNFRQTMMALARGARWDQAALPSPGNGAAMRIGPAALCHRDSPAALLNAVFDITRVTHADTRAFAAAAAVALLVARALEHEGPARELASAELLDGVLEMENRAAENLGTWAHHRDFSDGLGLVLSSLGQPREAVLSQIEIVASRSAGTRLPVTDGFAPASVLTAVYQFLTSASFEKTLIETVALGGDTDTLGAMAGQMCGALYGEGGIPSSWRNALAAYGALEDRIDGLLKRDPGWKPAVPVAELEGPWTDMILGRFGDELSAGD